MRYRIVAVVAMTFAFLAPFALEGTGQLAFAEEEEEEEEEEEGEQVEEEEEGSIHIPKGCAWDSERKLVCGSETHPEAESLEEDSIGKAKEPQ